ncbi:hypothetical protein AMS68_004623 [Peltaster fructicola]|uniref:RING-type domain-containing protein n=1 Tax=Peltaster fructicola TaxID=286661 RepID=A0A6H0XWP7_9PEZI|nr:hypothetical protein AMS68_004623 [Peltaster fructicola]
MDLALRCNSLKCRTQLADQAVVTTCSHIFCLPCADSLGMSNANSSSRTCPACGTHLINQDDAAVTNLSPTEDYKTSVLSGLSPAVIIECASRAMAFWTYQTTQEVFYQEFLMKSMTEKYHSLSGQMDKLITNANTEVATLRERMAAMQLDHKELENKNQQLGEACKKKCKDNGQLHKLYQQAKQRQVSDHMAEAAEQDASHVVQSLGLEFNNTGDYNINTQPNQGRVRSDESDGLRFGHGALSSRVHGLRIPTAQSHTTGNRSHLPMPVTGPAHGAGLFFRDQNARESAGSQRLTTPFRQPLGNLETNTYPHRQTDNFGLGTGMKFGRPSGGSYYRGQGAGGSMYGGR